MSYLDQILQRVVDAIGSYLPTLLLAVAVLVIGWLVARILSSLVRRGLHKTELDSRLVTWVQTEGGSRKTFPVEQWTATAVFWLVMLFVLVGFFQTLGLALVSEPFNRLLSEVFGYAPRLIGPTILALVAWVLATVLRTIVYRFVQGTGLDQKLAEPAEPEARTVPLSRTLSEAVYWLTLLLFLPAILGPLGLEGLLAPVQNLVDQLLGFLPRALGAALILLVGWFVARIAQRIVTSLLATVGLDGLAERVGVGKVVGSQRLSALIGTLVQVLILLPVLIASLDALAVEAITAPARAMLSQLLLAVPNIFAAVLILAIAYFIGRLAAGLVTSLLAAAGFDRILGRLGLGSRTEGDAWNPSKLAGGLVLAAVLLFAVSEAANVLGLTVVGELITQFTVFASQILLGLIIFGLGLLLADVAGDAIRSRTAAHAALIATVTRIAILALSGAMALRQMGIASEIINLAFGLTLGAIAVAAAIAFGLGARDAAALQVERWQRALDSQRSKPSGE